MIYEVLTLKDVQEKLDFNSPVFMDSETLGFYGHIRLVQFMQYGWDKAILVENPDKLTLAALLQRHHTVWHNAHYDLTTVQQQLGFPFLPERVDDTFLLSRIVQPEHEKYSLDAVLNRCLGYDPYVQAGVNKVEMQKTNWDVPVLTANHKLYAALDVYHMPELWSKLKEGLDTMSYKLDLSTLRSCLKFQWNGMPVDSNRLNAEHVKTTEKISSIDMPINANSYKQVREYLGGIEKSDKIYLSTLALRDGNEKAANVLASRQARKRLNFIEKYDEERIYGKFKPTARSGRLTSDDENLQQIPRSLKCVFGYPEDAGRCLIYSDYAQLELRTICAIIGVSLMEQLFRDGEDLHGYVAKLIFGDNWTKKDRQVTKTYNFNLLYGGSVGMVLSILITYGLWIEEREATRHKRKWLNIFPEINKWQQECIAKWRRGALNSTPMGREYKAKLMTDFMNIMNQGAGAEVAKLALHYFLPRLEQFNSTLAEEDRVYVCNFVHDSFILDAPIKPEVYEPASKLLAECMQEAWFECSKLFKIKDLPMPVDVKVGLNWGDLEEDIGVMYDYQLEGMALYNKM